MFLPENVKILIEKLNKCGYCSYAVGGCVRDSIMGKSADDYDITTSAVPEQIKEALCEYRTIDTGLKHGTVTVISGGSPVEITTFRKDGNYLDNRHPESVVFTSSVEEDLARRDFTVNAIAYSHEAGFVDPYGGKKDIENRIIRCVGNADDRFKEDALRIMRALRFSSVLGFGIEESTASAVLENKSLLANISAERIQKELFKLLRGKNVFEVLMSYAEVIFEIIPELSSEYKHVQLGKKHAYDIWEHTCHTVESIDSSDEYLRIVMLLHDVGKADVEKITDCKSDFSGHAQVGAEKARTILKRLKCSAKVTDTVSYLVSVHDKPIPDSKIKVKYYLREMGEDNFIRFLMIKRADRGALAEGFRDVSHEISAASSFFEEIRQNKECYSLDGLAINGADVMNELNLEGTDVGDCLSNALNAVIEEKCSNIKDNILNYLKGEFK